VEEDDLSDEELFFRFLNFEEEILELQSTKFNEIVGRRSEILQADLSSERKLCWFQVFWFYIIFSYQI
jgi:hypothetical protein